MLTSMMSRAERFVVVKSFTQGDMNCLKQMINGLTTFVEGQCEDGPEKEGIIALIQNIKVFIEKE